MYLNKFPHTTENFYDIYAICFSRLLRLIEGRMKQQVYQSATI